MEVRRSAEKYHAACEACVRSKQTLVNIEQSISAAADNAAASVSAEQQESLNRATDEVSMLTLPFTLLLQFHSLCSAVTCCVLSIGTVENHGKKW